MRAPLSFFVSSSSGSDNNIGTNSGAPWQTLTKLSTVPFVPGDQIFLKAGDTWVGQTFLPIGSGSYDTAGFTSSYNSTFATQNAAYLAGATYTNFFNLMVAAGQSTATANASATEYCKRLAQRDAVLAAHTAAYSTSTWITMTSYGTGAHPKIAPGGTIPFGIQFPSSGWTGGWRIIGIDCGSAYACGIAKEGSIGNGMWIESCVFDSNRGMRVGVNGSDFSVPGYSLYASSGAHIAGVNYTMFRNCTCTNNNIPFGVRGGSYCVVDGVQAADNDINSAYMDYDTFSLMNGGHITRTGWTGYSAGTAGVLISNSNYVQFYGVEIDQTKNPVNNVDQIAIDLEANDNNTSIFNCNLHDNGDCAVFMNGDATQSGTMIVGNILNNNGLKSPTGTSAIIKAYPTNDPVIIAANTLTKAAPTQNLFSLLTWGGLTNTPPPLWTYSP